MQTMIVSKRFAGFLKPLDEFGRPIVLVESNNEKYVFDNFHRRVAGFLEQYPRFVGQMVVYDRDTLDHWVFNAVVFMLGDSPIIHTIDNEWHTPEVVRG